MIMNWQYDRGRSRLRELSIIFVTLHLSSGTLPVWRNVTDFNGRDLTIADLIKDMRKLLILAIMSLVPVAMSAQAQITTKKMKLEDFPEKVTKVVLSGNIFVDKTVEDAVKNRWTISPYEFCTKDEFEALKNREDYYFLITVLGQFRKEVEPGIEMLSLVKGGKGADLSLDKMLEVVSVPVCSADYPSGREITFMPALIDIIQSHVTASMKRDINAYGGLGTSSGGLDGARSKRVVFAREDISSEVDSLFLAGLDADKFEILPEAQADALMEAGAVNTLVSYTVYPYEAKAGSFCYKMLIDAHTHKLYYFRKHKISGNAGPGFLEEDIARIARR